LGRDLVLKIARDPVAVDPAGRDRLLAEGRLLAELDHPNLVRVLDLDFQDDRPFVVMEYVAGRTLLQHATSGALAPRRAAALVAELARAVEYIHGRGVVHQDITPRNVLIDAAGRPRLIDFGLARLRHAWSEDRADWTGGTARYISPEQVGQCAEGIGPWTDVFGLGGLLYHLLTGQPLYQGASHRSVLRQAMKAEYLPVRQLNRRVPRGLERICHKALAADPGRRYRTAGELERALGWFLARRQIGAAALLALLLSGVGLLALRPRPADPGGGVEATAAAAPGVEPPANPTPAPVPLKIEPLWVDHFRFQDDHHGERFDPIGSSREPILFNDELKVSTRLSAPAYFYLVALNPDGQVQICLPPKASDPPSPSRELRYPIGAQYFPLTDGSGLQVFVVLASRRRLPPYAQWEGSDGLRQRWKPVAADDVHGVWGYRDGEVTLICSVPRGEPRIRSGPPLFKEICEDLKDRPDVEAIEAIAFPVRPLKK
jgi:serine/threonine protein kinase